MNIKNNIINSVFDQLDRPGISVFLKLSLGFLLFISVALPTGSLFGIPFKHLAYFSTLISIVVLWAQQRIKIDTRILLVFVVLFGFTVFYVLVGAFQGIAPFGLVLKEASGVFTAVSIVLIIYACTKSGAVSNESVISYIFYGVLFFSLWKVAVVMGLVTGVFSFMQVYNFLVEQAGYRIVSSGIFGGLVRINLIVYDFLVAFMLVLMMVAPRGFSNVKKPLRILFYIVGAACVFFAFSRLLFGLLVIGCFYFFIFRANFKTRFIIVSLLMFVSVLSSAWLIGTIEQRFGSTGTAASDDIRSEQIVALIDEWSESPLIGRGFGAYSKSVIRDPMVPYSYEVQWVGFLAKLGSIGVSFLLFLVGVLYWKILSGVRQKEHYILFITLTVFIVGGFTNQYLVSSASGVIYCLHIIFSELVRKNRMKIGGLVNVK